MMSENNKPKVILDESFAAEVKKQEDLEKGYAGIHSIAEVQEELQRRMSILGTGDKVENKRKSSIKDKLDAAVRILELDNETEYDEKRTLLRKEEIEEYHDAKNVFEIAQRLAKIAQDKGFAGEHSKYYSIYTFTGKYIDMYENYRKEGLNSIEAYGKTLDEIEKDLM